MIAANSVPQPPVERWARNEQVNPRRRATSVQLRPVKRGQPRTLGDRRSTLGQPTRACLGPIFQTGYARTRTGSDSPTMRTSPRLAGIRRSRRTGHLEPEQRQPAPTHLAASASRSASQSGTGPGKAGPPYADPATHRPTVTPIARPATAPQRFGAWRRGRSRTRSATPGLHDLDDERLIQVWLVEPGEKPRSLVCPARHFPCRQVRSTARTARIASRHHSSRHQVVNRCAHLSDERWVFGAADT
jgi:hypothetical protein